MRKYRVYVHVCPNGKRYVGCTTRVKPEIRWAKGNGYRYNKHFYSAILKYGWDNITHEVFEVESKEEMYRKEIELISFYHSNDPKFGYNNSSGGEKSSLGCKYSEEIRKKMSEAHKGKSLGKEHRKHVVEATKKKWADPEYRKHMSEVQKKVHSDPEYLRKQSEVRSDPEYRRKLSEAHKGKVLSEETKKKMSEAQKKIHSDPEYRKHMSEIKKGKPHKPYKPLSEETKRRMSEAKKGKPLPKVKIKLPDGTTLEMSKQVLTRWYVNKGRKFEYVS